MQYVSLRKYERRNCESKNTKQNKIKLKTKTMGSGTKDECYERIDTQKWNKLPTRTIASIRIENAHTTRGTEIQPNIQV